MLLLLTCASAFAQQTTGTVTGRVVDQQGSAVPGATVTAKSTTTGFTRTEVSDAEGVYRLSALPVGIYDVTAELQGFTTVSKKGVEVNVAQTQAVDFPLKVAQLAETVNVTGATPLIQTTASSVGAVVDVKRIESIPLNGRQFANLAATVPGVGLSFHTDPTKSTQYAPLVNGGSGRNINYQIDGGDNNDDTVGGQLEAFPLEAIEQFNFQTQRFKAEYGRSNGGVLSVVTKSGTNLWSGSAFEFFRDKSMNALTETEILAAGAGSPVKGDYRQNQFGGSFGGPIAERPGALLRGASSGRIRTRPRRSTPRDCFPIRTACSPCRTARHRSRGKVTANLNANQFLSVRYGRDTNSQPYNAAPNSTFNNWGDSANKYNSFNLNHNWVMSGSKLNEFIFQYADFGNTIASRSSKPNESFPNGVTTGANGNTPQTTEQRKFQFRDDFSWHMSGGGGLGHDFKVGANFINEPHLFITFNTGKGVTFNTHITNDVNGPISLVTVSDGNAGANMPMKQFATYFQDDWRVSDRLTLNFGVRYDYMVGYQIDESKNPNFVAVQAAGAAGKLSGIVGLENFGQTPQEDRNNIQPRLGAVYDLRGNGKDIVRGGWGIYTDVGYTNSNVLFAATDSTGEGFGQIFNVNVTNGIKNPDGSFYKAGQPLSNISSQNQVVSTGAFPLTGQWIDPRLQQPYQMQSNVGWSHELTSDTVFAVDYVNSLGRDLNLRPRVNQRIPGSLSNPRRLAAIIPTLTPNTNGNRPTVSRGESEYNAMILSVRRRLFARLRLPGELHAAERCQHGRHGGRRAEHGEHSGSEQPVRRSAAARADVRHRLASPDQHQRVVPAALGHPLRADLLLPLRAACVSRRRPRHQPRRRRHGNPDDRLCGRFVRRVEAAAPAGDGQAGRQLRDGELRPRLLPDADQPAPLEGLQPRRPRARRGDWRDLQPVQQHQPERIPDPRDRAGLRHTGSEPAPARYLLR